MDIFTLLDAAAECMSPDQYEALQNVLTSDGVVADKSTPGDRLARCIAKRMASQPAAAAGQEAVHFGESDLGRAVRLVRGSATPPTQKVAFAAPATQPATLALTDAQRRAIHSGSAALKRLGWTDPAGVLDALLNGAKQ